MSRANEPAYPHLRRYVTPDTYEPLSEGGMTLREHFAGLAMQGYLAGRPSDRGFTAEHYAHPYVAASCVRYADCLIAELAKDSK